MSQFNVGDIVVRTGGNKSEICTGTRCRVLRVGTSPLGVHQIHVKVLGDQAGVPPEWAYGTVNFKLAPPQRDEQL